MQKKRYKANPAVRVAAVLICLVLVTTYMISGMYARYVSTGSVSDDARTAKYYITSSMPNSEPQAFRFTINPQTEEQEFTIQVINSSETLVRCTATLEQATENLPLAVNVDGTDGFSKSFDLSTTGSGASHEFKFTVKWDRDGNDNFMYSGMVDHLVVQLHYEQID